MHGSILISFDETKFLFSFQQIAAKAIDFFLLSTDPIRAADERLRRTFLARFRLLWLHIERATAADKPRSPLRSAYPIGADVPDQLLQNFGAPILVTEGNLDFRISMQLSITANSNSRQMPGELREPFNCWYATNGRTILSSVEPLVGKEWVRTCRSRWTP